MTLKEIKQRHVFKAAAYGQLATVDDLVKQYGLDIHYVDEHGNNALLEAARYGENFMLEHLIDNYRMDVDHRNNRGETALDIARKWSKSATIELLTVAVGRSRERNLSKGSS